MPKRRRLDVEHLAAAQRAAKVAGASAGQWWKTLSAAADATTTEQSLDRLFRDAIVAMSRSLEVDTVAILLANESGDELIARAATGLDEEVSLNVGIRAGQGMAGWVLENRRPLIVADISKINIVTPGLRNSGLRSVVAVPILSDEHPLGVLYAGSYELDRFNASDAAMLELLSDRLSSAIERVRLFETERAARAEAERLADRLARIQGITSRLAAANTAGDVATALTELLTEGSGDRDLIWTSAWLRRDDLLEPIGLTAPEAEGSEFRPLPLHGNHPVAIAARTTQPMYFEDPDENAERFPLLGWAFPTSNFAVVPIMLHRSCLGVVVAVYRGSGGVSPERREFLGAVVGQVAQALQRARLSEARDQLAEISAFFARAAKVLAEGNDLTDTLDRLASVALPALGDICLIDVVDEGGRISRKVAKHRDPSRQHLVNRLRTRYSPEAEGSHPAAEVFRTGQTRWSADMSEAFLSETTQDDEHLALTKALGFHSYISVPLKCDGETIGCVTLVSITRRYGIDDVAFAEQLAEQVSAVVNKARRYDMAARTSHILQSTLLPKRFPEVPGLVLHTRYIAASEGLEVGGDFFDVVRVSRDRIAFMIGDVAGHDRNAAALMGQLRSAARTLVGRVDSPAELISALQQSWERLDFDRMATGVFGQLDVASGELIMASAGHYPPLLVDRGDARFVGIAPSTPLGVRGPEPSNWRGWLKGPQALLLYTDGAIDERRIGCERSMANLAQAAQAIEDQVLDLSALCDRVVDTLSPDRVDDVALLAVRLDPGR
jgi:serine/threonine-protein kinase RsbW